MHVDIVGPTTISTSSAPHEVLAVLAATASNTLRGGGAWTPYRPSHDIQMMTWSPHHLDQCRRRPKSIAPWLAAVVTTSPSWQRPNLSECSRSNNPPMRATHSNQPNFCRTLILVQAIPYCRGEIRNLDDVWTILMKISHIFCFCRRTFKP